MPKQFVSVPCPLPSSYTHKHTGTLNLPHFKKVEAGTHSQAGEQRDMGRPTDRPCPWSEDRWNSPSGIDGLWRDRRWLGFS